MSSNFVKVSKDSFHGVDTKAKVPDGASGRSSSKYSTVDGNIDIEAGGCAFIVFSGNATTPVKAFSFSKAGANANAGSLSVVNYKNVATSLVQQGQYQTYKELTWKQAACEPGIKNFSRTHGTVPNINRLTPGNASEDGEADGDINENFFVDEGNSSSNTNQYGRVGDHLMTISAQAGGVDTCPKRWRMVSSSLKIQTLNKAEYSAGYWKAVDYFPQRSYQTLGLYYPHSKLVAEDLGTLAYGTATPPLTQAWGKVIKSTTNVIGLSAPPETTAGSNNIKVGLDLKLIDEFLSEEPYYGEKPSYNEGSLESLKAVQFNLQRKAGSVDWCTQGIVHTKTPQRLIGSTEIKSKLPVTLQNTSDLYDPSVEKQPSSHASDRMYYEHLPTYPDVDWHNVNHRLYGFHTTSSATAGDGTLAPATSAGAPACMSMQGLEADAAMKQIIEAQQDLNMSTKCIIIRNTGQQDCKFRLSTAAVFEITSDLDSTDHSHEKPTLRADAATMRKMQKLGGSASRRISR